jgi:hypothetical protein
VTHDITQRRLDTTQTLGQCAAQTRGIQRLMRIGVRWQHDELGHGARTRRFATARILDTLDREHRLYAGRFSRRELIGATARERECRCQPAALADDLSSVPAAHEP